MIIFLLSSWTISQDHLTSGFCLEMLFHAAFLFNCNVSICVFLVVFAWFFWGGEGLCVCLCFCLYIYIGIYINYAFAQEWHLLPTSCCYVFIKAMSENLTVGVFYSVPVSWEMQCHSRLCEMIYGVNCSLCCRGADCFADI